MRILNTENSLNKSKNTRQDVTTFFLQYMEGKLTKAEFEVIAGVTKKTI